MYTSVKYYNLKSVDFNRTTVSVIPNMEVCRLVLRPSYRPVYDRLTEVGEGSPIEGTYYTHAFFVSNGAVHFSLHKYSKLQLLGQKLQDKASSSFFQCILSMGDRSSPPLST